MFEIHIDEDDWESEYYPLMDKNGFSLQFDSEEEALSEAYESIPEAIDPIDHVWYIIRNVGESDEVYIVSDLQPSDEPIAFLVTEVPNDTGKEVNVGPCGAFE